MPIHWQEFPECARIIAQFRDVFGPGGRVLYLQENGKTYGSYFAWIQKLTKLRKAHKSLTHGDQAVVWATDHTGAEGDAGIFAFERTGGDAGSSYALVVTLGPVRTAARCGDGEYRGMGGCSWSVTACSRRGGGLLLLRFPG